MSNANAPAPSASTSPPVSVGDFAYVRPRIRVKGRRYASDSLPAVHRGTVTAVRPGSVNVEDALVEVTFDDVPVTVKRVQEFYVDEIPRFTRLVPGAAHALSTHSLAGAQMKVSAYDAVAWKCPACSACGPGGGLDQGRARRGRPGPGSPRPVSYPSN